VAALLFLTYAAGAEEGRRKSPEDAVPILVTLSRYRFSPGGPGEPPIRLQAGTTYRITFRSADVEHGISAIPVLGIEGREVSPGEDYAVTVSPTAAQAGRYNFACTRVCGAGHGGMFGAIEVEEPEDPGILRLGDGRFRVEAVWSASNAGTSGVGTAVPLTSDTGAFWFFQPSNLELVLKVLDGRAINGHFWVFYGALSNVEYAITVTDTETGAVRRYHNPEGRLASEADTEAF
jgi:cytochrome c oxidase subunit 2